MDARTGFIITVVVIFLLRAGSRLAQQPGIERPRRTGGTLLLSSTLYLCLALWGLGTILI